MTGAPSLHKCPGCAAEVRHDRLACPGCWRTIPKPLRDAVWAAWDRGMGAGSAAHRAAITTAIGWLATKAAPAAT